MKVAIIGGGVSGLSSLWALTSHSDHEAHLYESGDYIGGHTNTVRYVPTPAAASPDGADLQPVDVDTGFIVFNTVTYPNFLRFVQHIGAEILQSDMSFSVSRHGIARGPKVKALFGAKDGERDDSAATATTPPSHIRGWFEWAGSSPGALFCQATNWLNPSHWRMVWDIVRFNYQSLETLRAASHDPDSCLAHTPIGQWLDERGYGPSFRRNYLVPMTASIWSTPPQLAFSQFPALTLLRFMHNHHLLQILDRPQWLTLKGGSQSYVRKVLEQVPPQRIHHDEQGGGRVVAIERVQGGQGAGPGEAHSPRWRVRSAAGHEETYDALVLATHADTALALLDPVLDASDDRRDILASFQFSDNEAVLHADESLMPVAKSAWSAWNFIAVEVQADGEGEADAQAKNDDSQLTSKNKSKSSVKSTPPPRDTDRVSLTYWMNLLQSLPSSAHGPVLVTLNPPPSPHGPSPSLVAARFRYTHPIYTSSSVRSQARLAPLQGRDSLHFAGAWLKYGFHEDGFSSGLRAAVALGAAPPFAVRSAERGVPPRGLGLGDALVRAGETLRAGVLQPLGGALLAPVVLLLSVVLESVGNLLRAEGWARGAQRVRLDWEEAAVAAALRRGGSGGHAQAQGKGRKEGRRGVESACGRGRGRGRGAQGGVSEGEAGALSR